MREMIWKEMPVLTKTAREITQRGGVPVKMLLAEDGLKRLAVIVSHDPSGPNHSREFHASVSASIGGVRCPPAMDDVRAVAGELGLLNWETSLPKDGLVGHIWSPLA
jgi:hypothetical protein